MLSGAALEVLRQYWKEYKLRPSYARYRKFRTKNKGEKYGRNLSNQSIIKQHYTINLSAVTNFIVILIMKMNGMMIDKLIILRLNSAI